MASEKIGLRKRQYQQAFVPGSPAYDALIDLAKFCHFAGGDGVNDHDVALIFYGRRQAYCRILDHLHLEPDELTKLYSDIRRGDE